MLTRSESTLPSSQITTEELTRLATRFAGYAQPAAPARDSQILGRRPAFRHPALKSINQCVDLHTGGRCTFGPSYTSPQNATVHFSPIVFAEIHYLHAKNAKMRCAQRVPCSSRGNVPLLYGEPRWGSL